jgi:hypothetical protein
MPVKRRAAKARRHRITPEAIAAYRARDYLALHQALGLKPWEISPLPREFEALGVDQNPPPKPRQRGGWFDTWEQAQELQRLLEAACR